MIVTEPAAVSGELPVSELLRARHVAEQRMRVILAQPREDAAERRGEFGQGGVLLGREIILDQRTALNRSGDRTRAGRTADKMGVRDTRITNTSGDGQIGR